MLSGEKRAELTDGLLGVGDNAFISSAAAVPSPGALLDTAMVAALATMSLCRTSSLHQEKGTC
jgi:hypothetical protein